MESIGERELDHKQNDKQSQLRRNATAYIMHAINTSFDSTQSTPAVTSVLLQLNSMIKSYDNLIFQLAH